MRSYTRARRVEINHKNVIENTTGGVESLFTYDNKSRTLGSSETDTQRRATMTLNKGDKVKVIDRGSAMIGDPDAKYELYVNGSFRAFITQQGIEDLRRQLSKS